jgi:hypothetical protein
MDDTFCQDRLVKTLELINIYDAAITAIVTDGAQQYTLDTGQSRQVVTKLDIASLQRILAHLENKYVTLQARCQGRFRTHGRPDW